jgi:hypothetical protein
MPYSCLFNYKPGGKITDWDRACRALEKVADATIFKHKEAFTDISFCVIIKYKIKYNYIISAFPVGSALIVF